MAQMWADISAADGSKRTSGADRDAAFIRAEALGQLARAFIARAHIDRREIDFTEPPTPRKGHTSLAFDDDTDVE